MDGAFRTGIPYTSLKEACMALDVPLTDVLLIKFNRCVRLICKQAAEAMNRRANEIKAKSQPQPKNRVKRR